MGDSQTSVLILFLWSFDKVKDAPAINERPKTWLYIER